MWKLRALTARKALFGYISATHIVAQQDEEFTLAFHNTQSDFRPTSGEAPFNLDEVFFSRTDSRGVILAGNEVFRRVANFDWSELLNAPHKIVRHPDMPRGIFWLLWDRIQKGQPIGAYVKNQAKDGLYYWVFAAVMPCEGGYISARIKPTSKVLEQIQQEYAALRAAEDTENLSPEESANRLLARLKELGFSRYGQFSAEAMSQELQARDAGLKKPEDVTLSRYAPMRAAAYTLSKDTSDLIRAFHQMRTIPHNMQVIASRLEPSGGPVSTLSQNYGSISREMSDWFGANIAQENNSFEAIQDSISEANIQDNMIRILKECDAELVRETLSTDKVDIEHERQRLSDLLTLLERQSREKLLTIRTQAEHIRRTCDTMDRHVTGLSSTRILAKIEAGRIQNVGEGLGDIIVQLGKFQTRIADKLDEIAQKSETILGLIE